jgi:hypothetical protein
MSRPTSTPLRRADHEDVLQPGDDHGAGEFGLDLLLDGLLDGLEPSLHKQTTHPLDGPNPSQDARSSLRHDSDEGAMEMPKVSRDSAPQRPSSWSTCRRSQ